MSLDLTGLSLPPALGDVMTRLARVGVDLARTIARNGIDMNLAEARGVNMGGDGQKALDVIADEAFMEALAGSEVRYYASEEQDEVVALNDTGSLALAIDPLDGSSNIDVNVSIGTIFSIFPSLEDPNESFLRQGTEQLAGGYIIYGPQCCLVCTFGDGVVMWVLDPDTHSFRRVAAPQAIPEDTTEYAINASNYRHWPHPVRAFIDDCVAGAEGPRGKNFNMRWVASLVAETHRILTRGGIFLYPGDDRKGYARGRLRHVYECAPIAFLVTQAGGGATDGAEPILEALPDALHARTPFVFGSASKVARVVAYHDLPEEETSALFNTRGLFRS
ncbi:class 1 fructose-bisphosphatase [Phaeovulum vinaykumarii]|uniref:Fructose-1,6-bisphosphatase class 1 n=1 Tax=Phaeovulum vinaykumarii TaxID=407234 RepID=A0A1N7LI71_9RHOB|nr:class 1 fructose-bisphosphatase [Phaeovulum vinaykumarii]SIS73484.1 D-fructose 1,6-bisphosphatase [Phaeovulum vinaykumarii]SOC04699.1 D-fructose 1,6-bisphosphatase [Phaeovulum vinaykumarii]